MFYHKKGQSATEYLMTYAWAILAIAIVGALLYTQVFSQKACAVEGASGFQLIDAATVGGKEFSIDATTGDLKVALKNQVGKNVTVTSVLKDTTVFDITDVVIADGSTNTITVPAFATGTVGKCYTYQTTFVYNTSSGIDLRNSGTLNGRY